MDDSEKLAKIVEGIKSRSHEETARIILDLANNVEKLLENNKQSKKIAEELLDELTVTEPSQFQIEHQNDQELEKLFNALLRKTERSMTLTRNLTSLANKIQQERKRRRDRVNALRADRGSDE